MHNDDDDDDHPLLVELASLRQTAARFQASHEAHAAAIKLQRHTFDVSRIHEHAASLEQENARLTHEISILHAHPEVPPHPAVAQVQELSLALRRVSDKIDLTEQTLLERTSELVQARSEFARSRQTADGAYELAARMRAREEAAKARERELELKAYASEEERRMVDLVVQEYADLVRNLEGRKSAHDTPSIANGSTSTTTLVDTLQDGKSNLHRMLTEFSTESENLHATIAELDAQVSTLQMTLEAERITASHDRTLFSQTKTELDKLNLEDQTAAKMVTRYMKFSQASTNALQQQITTLKTRHASTIATLEVQLSIAESQLESERARTVRLQDALDELCPDLARESYGRRREVALRLALLSREEGVAEFMRRWARRARELYARCYNATQPVSSEDAVQEAFHRIVTDAESLLSTLDDDIQLSDGTHMSGSQARMALSRAAVDALRGELQDEMQKRIEAIRKSASSLPNGHLDGITLRIEGLAQPEDTSSPEGDGDPEEQLLTPNGNALPEYTERPVELSQPQDADSPVSMVGAPEETVDDPFLVSAPVAPPATGITEHTIVQEEINCLPSASIQGTASTSATLLVEEPNTASVRTHSPAVSMLDLREDLHPSCAKEPPTTDVAPIHALPSDTPISSAPVQAEDDTVIPPMSISTSTPAEPHAVLDTPSPIDPPPTLLSELGATKHRYDALQRAFRDCSLALKDLKRTLASSSPSPHTRTKHGQHLEVALARIDDFAEDARVELEIRIADEELTVRGFEMVLSIPAALVDADERTEVEASARAFVDGTDGGVTKALDKFGKKLEDVQHDVAVVKRAVHGLAMSEGEGEAGEWRDEDGDESSDAGAAAGWTGWTAGLLGAVATPSRSQTPVETFGAVMTSPRLRHAASLKQLHAQNSTQESTADDGPLAGLNLRIPMPMTSPSHARWGHLGLGRAMEGETRPRTLSAMYALGGLRSSSIALGVGLGGSPSPARARGMTGLGLRMRMESVSSQGYDMDDTQGTNEVQDLGGVE
ncbi:hypothetical protein JVT61DRAFT_8838 [Boletus reticuloceps]|uniref:Uncharacterized protein n=1 Tax=Boletus reticuloceps TaxID=495285 RepID=A0A8I3A530_9AGAM|nr:hypothetical protein JVT61DRAFT_8838 [Boletus reticuloceps]